MTGEENVERRLAVTTMLAKMFSHKDSDLIQQDKSLWSQFLDRFRDAKPEVRQECAKYCKYFLVYHPTVAAEVAERLSSIVLDLDDRVRAEAVASVLDAAAENLASIPAKLLDTVSDRRIDKKPAIRLLTVERLARLFQSAARQANAEGEWSDAARTRVSQIPSLVLRCYFVNDPELRTCVERVTSQYLLPAKMPAAQAGERMITIFSNLDEHALAAMAKLLSRKRSVAEAFASLSAATKEGQDAVMTAVVRLCGFASEKDRPKVKEQLMKLAKNASKATFKALSACCAPDQDPETVAKARAQFAEAGRAGGKSSSFDCVLALVDLATPLAVTSERLIEYLPRLRELAESGEEDACEANTTVLLALARHARPVFEDKQVVKLLAANLGTASAALETGTLKVLPLLSDAVCALAPAVARSVKKQLSALAISGTPTQAKLATIYLTGLPDASRDDTVQNVYDTLVDSLDMNSPTLLTSLKALGYIALHAPDVFEVRQRDVISQFIVKKLLLHEPTPAEEKAQRSAAMKAARENEEEWSEEPSELCLAKVMGIKCIVRRLLGMKDVDPDALTQTSAASARLLFSLLDNVGQLKAEAYTPPPDRARLRLAAACGLLKLAGLKPLRAHISPPKFLSIGFVIQDSCNTVRCLFGAKLNKYLAQFILPLSYMSIFCLAAIDPVATNARTAAKYLQDNTQRRRKLTENSSETGAKRYNLNLLPEYALPHVISLLSYHPDFGTDPETLSEFQQYLQFFFQNIISKEHVNFDFLKGLLETMKTVKPAHDVGEGGHPKAMYILCDLALLILLKRSQKTGWKLSTFPGDIVLPQNLFARPSRPLNPKQRYLPASFEVDAGIGAAHGATSPKKAKASEKRRTPKKDGKAPSRRPKKAAKSKPEKVFAEPTRRNASRAAKANTKSLADLSDSAGSEEEEEEEPFSGSESASEENAPAARWQVTVPRAGTSVLEETQGNRRVDAPSPVKPMKANVEKAKGRKRAGSKRKVCPPALVLPPAASSTMSGNNNFDGNLTRMHLFSQSDPEEHPGSDAEQDSVTSSPTKVCVCLRVLHRTARRLTRMMLPMQLRRSGRRTIRT